MYKRKKKLIKGNDTENTNAKCTIAVPKGAPFSGETKLL